MNRWFFVFLVFHCGYGSAQGLDLGTISYSPQFISNLSANCNETSGLVYDNDTIFSINDGGNPAAIQAFSASNGQPINEWQVGNAQNFDWEALTLNDSVLFIADIGNNAGSRNVFDIYRVLRQDLVASVQTVASVKQSFRFLDQPTLPLQVNAHNYDAEAIFYFQDSLHVLTKNWENLWTRHYVLPCVWQDTLLISPRDSFYVNGLVTDAAYSAQDNKLYLLGYKKEPSGLYSSFMYRFTDFNGEILASDYQRIELGSTLSLAQTEGLCIEGPEMLFISGEQIASIITIAPKLHFINFFELLGNTKNSAKKIYFHDNTLFIPKDALPDFLLLDANGKEAIEWVLNKNQQDLSALAPGTYYLIGPTHRQTWIKRY